MKSKPAFGLLFFFLLGLLPFAAALVYALLYSLGIVGILSEGVSLAYWHQVLQSGELLGSFLYSALLAGTGVVLSVTLALWISMGLRTSLQHRFWSLLLYFPLAIPGMVASFLSIQLLSKAGFFSRISMKLGWIDRLQEFPDWINDSYGIGIILTFVLIVSPFFVILFSNVYQNERIAELSTLAYSLGAHGKQVFWQVTLPILFSKTKRIMILYFIFLLGSYEIPLVLGQESPQMLSVLIIRELKQFDLKLIPEGYVVAVAYTVVIAIAALLVFRRREVQVHE
ncbi:putative spermidine/putrescine transport system permease protein [Algoriphagus aquaeductus]|uniref:Putative spermidine/putrescine transport system permease protein n=1 Tax=Algoriphagus aquaeductus TaxID=475299 RepID=A0A326S6D4_9BACT|nr:ABC transporter permease subunit [Algoriphagus aquaeductus]PZV87132.1 putative spermidine/putrescine transport system permease protein [Algoriphagus aquaeductus]